ncbi:MAG: type IV pilus assembly protein PilM [Planctomycetes bacterium]|nr:type IV pilus assembly protein PilM [Planctomycetota bacterium]
MAFSRAAWGIEIGSNAIKAIRLEREGDRVRLADFCVIPHKKVLTTPDLDEDEMTRLSLGQLISQKTLEGEHLVISVPGHSAFARFAKLPPVEPKKVPDIVKFEAVQQIPFPIEEVEWDYQTFTSEDSPEVEVGIFAITRDRIQQRLSLYAELGLTPEAMTLSPVAVYNAMIYDLNLEEFDGPVIFLDIGTRATDVVVASEGQCWIRTFPLGGTHFTEAIASTFKLSYSKAEKLKYEAATSKYAKQIMQAMRPVFSDLLQDLQRSIGYFQSLHRDRELKTLVGLGSTFKIPGLRKFLGQQLQVGSIRLDEYRKIAVKGREAASFAENTVNMATAYGLALQGVGLAGIDVNLVPVKALREQVWHSKTKWFAAAAAIMVVGAGMTFLRPLTDQARLKSRVDNVVQSTLDRGGEFRKEYDSLKAQNNIGFSAENMRRLVDYRSIWPYLVNDAAMSLASTDPQPELLGNDPELILGIDPKLRRLVQLAELSGEYHGPEEESTTRRISITMDVVLSHDKPIEYLNSTIAKWLRDNAQRPDVPYKIIASSILCNPTLLEAVVVTEEGEQTRLATATNAPRRPRNSGNISGPGLIIPEESSRGAGMRGDRTPTKKITAPGAGAGSLSRGPGGSGAPGGRGQQTPSRARTRTNPTDTPGVTRTVTGVDGETTEDQNPFLDNLDKLAPMPESPKSYKPGDTYYKAVVTFEVEILDLNAPPPAASDQASSGSRQDEESNS